MKYTFEKVLSSISLKFGKLSCITKIYEKHRSLILHLSQSLLELRLSQSLLTSKIIRNIPLTYFYQFSCNWCASRKSFL